MYDISSVISSHFTDGETEFQRGKITCSAFSNYVEVCRKSNILTPLLCFYLLFSFVCKKTWFETQRKFWTVNAPSQNNAFLKRRNYMQFEQLSEAIP